MQTPKISVVMSVYNNAPYLVKSIESILDQTCDDFEFIIIDDGSTDDDYDRLTAIHPCIRVIHLEGRGVSFARNMGMRQAPVSYTHLTLPTKA